MPVEAAAEEKTMRSAVPGAAEAGATLPNHPPYRVNLPIRNSPDAKCHLFFLKSKVSPGPKPPLAS